MSLRAENEHPAQQKEKYIWLVVVLVRAAFFRLNKGGSQEE